MPMPEVHRACLFSPAAFSNHLTGDDLLGPLDTQRKSSEYGVSEAVHKASGTPKQQLG